MPQIGGLQRLPDDAPLERQGLHEAHKIRMGGRTCGGATLIRAMANDDVRLDGPLGLVVIRWHTANADERQEWVVMLEYSTSQALQGLVVIRLSPPVKQTIFQQTLTSQHNHRC